ncbi:MAG: Por secretion system C-terminal sorting protein [Bacteroidota bacterium]|nr:Por secretion system C-terminal sorting protein [Bacteroidota bacterium]
MKKSFTFLLFTCYLLSFSGTIQDSLRTDWSNPGVQGSYPLPAHIVSIMDFGGKNDSSADNTAALNAAVAALSGDGVVCIPEGKFLFTHPIVLPSNTILRGQGSDKTHLFFNLNGNSDFITASGRNTDLTSPILSGYKKDSSTVTVASSAAFTIGDYALVKEDGNTLMDPASTWAFPFLYQMVKIVNISGNNITFQKPLRLTFLASLNPVLVKTLPVKNVGIECLSMRRIDTTAGQTSNIVFNIAANCWVKGIESHNTNFGHIVLQSTTQCTVSGNYIHDAFRYGGGGQGYGVVMQFGSGENLVYDNILKHLRHCILFQAGVNGNVAAYNYSREQYWQESALPPDASGDIVFHGNYNFTNLVEGNICQNLIIDNSHSKNGQYNTFFRNRAEYYGIIMNSGAGDKMNFVGNEITNTGFLLGNYSLTGSNFQYGNNQHGTTLPGGFTTLPETTLIGAPYSSGIGLPNAIGSWKNAAYLRWSTSVKTVCDNVAYCSTATFTKQNKNDLRLEVFPNPSSGIFQFNITNEKENLKTFTVYNMKGEMVKAFNLNDQNHLQLNIDLAAESKGEYIIIVRTDDNAITQRIILQ